MPVCGPTCAYGYQDTFFAGGSARHPVGPHTGILGLVVICALCFGDRRLDFAVGGNLRFQLAIYLLYG
jgi:hypothetical protein